MDCSPPGSSIHGILQARILEWVAISFPRGSSWPRDRTQVSCIAGRYFNLWANRGLKHYHCKDQTYSHNLHFKITGLARRFYLETVLRQDTLLLYNPKECRGKKVCPFSLLENSRPLSPWGPLDILSTCLGNDSLILVYHRILNIFLCALFVCFGCAGSVLLFCVGFL